MAKRASVAAVGSAGGVSIRGAGKLVAQLLRVLPLTLTQATTRALRSATRSRTVARVARPGAREGTARVSGPPAPASRHSMRDPAARRVPTLRTVAVTRTLAPCLV